MRSKRVTAAIALATTLMLLAAQTTLAAHAVRHHGTHQIKQTFGVDFDRGVFNGGPMSREDMQFDAVSPGHRYLHPEGSTIARVGSNKPGYALCASVALGVKDYDVAEEPPDSWFCLKTSANRYVRFRLDAVHSDPGPITITYTTWEL